MTKSVNLYLASGVSEGRGFWIVDFTEEEDIFKCMGRKLLECYRKELFGLAGAIEVKEAINTTLDILVIDTKFERYKLGPSNIGYSFEIPIYLVEDIFDLWAYNYNNEIRWKKYYGLLSFRKKIKKNNFIYRGLKGESYEFAKKLDELLSFKPNEFLSKLDTNNELMW